MAEVKIGVLGCSLRGTMLAETAQLHPDAELVALCDSFRPRIGVLPRRACLGRKSVPTRISSPSFGVLTPEWREKDNRAPYCSITRLEVS
jgi:hypothetical protein